MIIIRYKHQIICTKIKKQIIIYFYSYFLHISVPQLHFDIVILNEIIKEKEKRILKLTEEYKQNMKRQIEEHNHMINFIQNISSVLNQNSSASVASSKQMDICKNKCYETQSDDTNDINCDSKPLLEDCGQITLKKVREHSALLIA